MGSVIKTFLFDADLEGWVLNGTGITRSTVDGYPTFGSLQAYAYGLSLTYTGGATWAGNYNDLGVPVGAIVTGIDIRVTEKISACTTGGSLNWNFKYNAGTSLMSAIDSATMVWSYRTLTTPITGLSIPSANSVDLAFSCVTKTGSKSTSATTAYFDQIQLTITYDLVALVPPTFTTTAAKAVTSSSATLNINVTSMGGVASYSSYFQYRKIGDTAWIATTPVARTAIGVYSLIQALDWGSFNYEYRAVIDYTDGTLQTVYGNILSVVVPILPTVVVSAATSILYDRATLNANITNMGTSASVVAMHQVRKVGEIPWVSSTGQTRTATGAYSTFVVGLDLYRFDYEVRAAGYVIIDGAAVWVYSASSLVVSYMDTGLVFIERSTGDNLNYALIAVVEDVDTLNPVSYDDSSGLIDGTLYYYRARRHKNKVFSTYSTEVAVIFQDAIAGFSSAVVTTDLEGLYAKVALGQSDTATIVATAEGSGVVVINTGPAGSSEITVFITSQSQGIKLARSPPSETSVVISVEGSVVTSKSGSAHTSVTVSQDGYPEKISIDGSEAAVVIDITGSGTTIRQGYSEANIVVTSEGSGQPILGNGSMASVSVGTEGLGFAIRDGGAYTQVTVDSAGYYITGRNGSSQESIIVSTDGSGHKILSSSSDVSITIGSQGTGIPIKAGYSAVDAVIESVGYGIAVKLGSSAPVVSVTSNGSGTAVKIDGSETSVSVAAVGAGIPINLNYKEGSSYTDIHTVTEGSGSAIKSGYSQINTFVVDKASGVKLASGESTSNVSARSAGYGRRVANGYSEATSSNVSTQGSGVHIANRNSQVTVATATQGAGYAIKNGRSQLFITATVTGQGFKAASGSASAYVVLVARGIAYKVAVGSSNVYTLVSAQGNGERVIEVYSGGSEALISVTTEEAGLKQTDGASECSLSIGTVSTWETAREGSSNASITVVSVGSGYNVPLPGIPVEIFLMPFDEVFMIDHDNSFMLPMETYIFVKLKEEDFMMVYDVDMVFTLPIEEYVFIVPKEDVFYAV